MRKVIFTLLVGVILTSGWAFAAVDEDESIKADTPKAVDKVKMADEFYFVDIKDDQVHRAERTPWAARSSKGSKAVIDTIAHFTGESGGSPTWQDRKMAPAEWDTVDNTIPPPPEDWVLYWHVDTVEVVNGDSAWWCGDPSIGPYGGYGDDWYQTLISPVLHLPAGSDSIVLEFDQLLRCEINTYVSVFSWDGYNVRIDTSDFATDNFFEIKPYHPEDDSSYYKPPIQFPPSLRNHFGEYDSLWCWDYNRDPKGHGGISVDSSTVLYPRIFDFSDFAGDSVKFQIVFSSDGAYNTEDDEDLIGLIVDDIKVTAFGTKDTVLLNETCEAAQMPHKMTPATWFADPTGNYWWLSTPDAHTGIYKAWCSLPGTGNYVSNLENALVSPKIYRANLDTNMADMWLDWWLKCQVDAANTGAYNEFKLDDGDWSYISTLHGVGSYYYGLGGVTNSEWWTVYQWSDFMHDMSPLITDTSIHWDSLQVAVGFFSREATPPVGGLGLKVDDITLFGRIGYPNDLGVTAAKIPMPNSNDVRLYMDTVAVENYGFNTAGGGNYFIKMTIVDGANNVVFGPATQIAHPGPPPPPDIPPLQTRKVALDTSVANFTLTQEGPYTFYIWSEWTAVTDDDGSNDTLATEYTPPSKALHYPDTYNYPAGLAELRYHDQGLYMYPYFNVREMLPGEIAAVHFTPEERFYPFDLGLAIPHFNSDGSNVTLKVWGPGVDDDHPGTLWFDSTFTTTVDSLITPYPINLDLVANLQHLSTDFWMGVEWADTVDRCMAYEGGDDPTLSTVQWNHSYLYTEGAWEQHSNDWYFEGMIRFRSVVDPIAVTPSQSGPPKNSSGNLYLDWNDVSQTYHYRIYRGTDAYGSAALFDSAAASNYTDNSGVVGDVNTHYYYQILPVHQDSSIYGKASKRVGEFDRSVIKAK